LKLSKSVTDGETHRILQVKNEILQKRNSVLDFKTDQTHLKRNWNMKMAKIEEKKRKKIEPYYKNECILEYK